MIMLFFVAIAMRMSEDFAADSGGVDTDDEDYGADKDGFGNDDVCDRVDGNEDGHDEDCDNGAGDDEYDTDTDGFDQTEQALKGRKKKDEGQAKLSKTERVAFENIYGP